VKDSSALLTERDGQSLQHVQILQSLAPALLPPHSRQARVTRVVLCGPRSLFRGTIDSSSRVSTCRDNVNFVRAAAHCPVYSRFDFTSHDGACIDFGINVRLET
jgi:hypothetical protein